MRRAAVCLALTACSPLPEPTYFRDGYDLGTDFDHPVCEGTLRGFEQQIRTVADFAGRHHNTTLQIYWLTDDLTRVCPREVNGCFLPGTSMIAARQQSVHHELVHAVLDSRSLQPFLEEGAAEVLGGESVYFEPRYGRPIEALDIDSRSYRKGAVDYPAASHFFHFLRNELGTGFLRSVVHAIDIGESPEGLVELLEHGFGRGADGIEARYKVGSPSFYAGLWRDEAWTITADDLVGRLQIELDCDDPRTMGPVDENTGGMYVAGRLALEDWTFGYLTVSGDESVELAIFREADLAEGTFVQNWWHLEPDADPQAMFARPGEGISIGLDPSQPWILMLSAPDADTIAHAQVWLSTIDPV